MSKAFALNYVDVIDRSARGARESEVEIAGEQHPGRPPDGIPEFAEGRQALGVLPEAGPRLRPPALGKVSTEVEGCGAAGSIDLDPQHLLDDPIRSGLRQAVLRCAVIMVWFP